MSRPRIYFLSGMGSDERLIEPQRALDADVIALPWIAHEPDDTLGTYAVRLAKTFDTSKPFYLGGISLGAMLAYEMAADMGPNLRGLILLVGANSYRDIPLLYRMIGRVVGWLPAFTLRIGKSVVPAVRKLFGISTRQQARLFQSMLGDADVHFLKWSLRAILHWPGPAKIADVPMLWIYAQRDLILPRPKHHAGVVVPGAGHTVNVTHAAEVNAIITAWLAEHAETDRPTYNHSYGQPATEDR